MKATLAEVVGRPCGDEQHDCAKAEGRNGPEIGLDNGVVVSADNLGKEVGADGGGGTVAQRNRGEDPEFPVPEWGEKRLHGELGVSRGRSVGEESVSSDLLLPRRQESRDGWRPRQAEVHEDGEGTCKSSLQVSGRARREPVTPTLTSRMNRICQPCRCDFAWKTPYEMSPEKAPESALQL